MAVNGYENTKDGNISYSNQRVLYLDFLRGLAILYIIGIRHLDDYAGGIYYSKLDDIITYIFLGLFVFISGYLLSIKNSIKNKADFLNFFVKRFLRIYPLYVLALFLFMICSLTSVKPMLLNMFFLNVLFGNSILTLWFVSIICVFYFLYPIIIYNYSILKTSAIFIVFSVFVFFMNNMFGLFDIRLLIYFPLFLLGVIISKYNLLLKYIFERHIVICSILLFVVTLWLYFEIAGFKKLFLTLLMISSLPSLLLIGKYFSSIINESIYAKIAYASYCMYLFHRVIFFLMTKIYSPKENIHMAVYLTTLGVPIIFGASFYIQRYYDMLISYLRRRARA